LLLLILGADRSKPVLGTYRTALGFRTIPAIVRDCDEPEGRMQGLVGFPNKGELPTLNPNNR